MTKKLLYVAPLAEAEQARLDSVLCDSAAVTTENFDTLTDYEW